MIDRPHVLNALAMQTLDEMIDALDTLLERMARLPIPIVAAVNGAAAGGGCGIALAADGRARPLSRSINRVSRALAREKSGPRRIWRGRKFQS